MFKKVPLCKFDKYQDYSGIPCSSNELCYAGSKENKYSGYKTVEKHVRNYDAVFCHNQCGMFIAVM